MRSVISASRAKARFGALLDRISKGDEFVITRRGQPIARLKSERPRNLNDVKQAVAGLRQLQNEISQGVFGTGKLTWEDFKAFVTEGRH